MKNSNPISLFSFQDIITCLTGIMIVIVLVILLQLVDALSKTTGESDLTPQYNEKKQERDLLKARKNELLEKLRELEKENKKIMKSTPDELAEKIKREQVYLRYLSESLQKTDAVLEKEKEIQKQLAAQLEEQIQIKEKTALSENELEHMQAELEELKEKERQLRKDYERKKNFVRFSFVGMNERTPILIECSSWGFQTKVYPDGEKRVWGTKDSSKFMDLLPELKKYVMRFEKNEIYLVFFFREQTMIRMEDILNVFSDYKVGKEVLESWEDCIYE